MERNSSGALRAPGAFGARFRRPRKSAPHAAPSSSSLLITHVCWLAAVLRPSAFGRGTADDAASGRAGLKPFPPRVCLRPQPAHSQWADHGRRTARLE